jgi:hypothetical protein
LIRKKEKKKVKKREKDPYLIHLIGHGLKVNGRGRDLLLGSLVTVGETAMHKNVIREYKKKKKKKKTRERAHTVHQMEDPSPSTCREDEGGQ